MAQGKRDLEREQRWREHLERQHRSGLSIRAFCAREQLTESAFYAWRREVLLRDREQVSSGPALVPMVVTPAPPPPLELIVELCGGRVLRVPAEFPAPRLTELVRAVEAAS